MRRRGFAMGWDYAFGWLVILPFELIAAGITIEYWRTDINIGVWITVFLTVLAIIQFFGVRGYGEGQSKAGAGLPSAAANNSQSNSFSA